MKTLIQMSLTLLIASSSFAAGSGGINDGSRNQVRNEVRYTVQGVQSVRSPSGKAVRTNKTSLQKLVSKSVARPRLSRI